VKSVLSYEKISFEAVQARLLDLTNTRIRNGEYTERGLARILGISQPQLHNVLKGARKLHLALADQLLIKFGLTLLDLLSEHELEEALRTRPGSPAEYYVLSGRVDQSAMVTLSAPPLPAPVVNMGSARSPWRKPAGRSDSSLETKRRSG
jgi:plasmid maintenance system antidote protein VapI